MRLFQALKGTAAVALNLGLLKYSIDANAHFENGLNNMDNDTRLKLDVRNYTLRHNPYFLSGSPYLRKMAIAAYEQNNELQRQAKFEYITTQKISKP